MILRKLILAASISLRSIASRIRSLIVFPFGVCPNEYFHPNALHPRDKISGCCEGYWIRVTPLVVSTR